MVAFGRPPWLLWGQEAIVTVVPGVVAATASIPVTVPLLESPTSAPSHGDSFFPLNAHSTRFVPPRHLCAGQSQCHNRYWAHDFQLRRAQKYQLQTRLARGCIRQIPVGESWRELVSIRLKVDY
jgi:hypothetical protein